MNLENLEVIFGIIGVIFGIVQNRKKNIATESIIKLESDKQEQKHEIEKLKLSHEKEMSDLKHKQDMEKRKYEDELKINNPNDLKSMLEFVNAVKEDDFIENIDKLQNLNPKLKGMQSKKKSKRK